MIYRAQDILLTNLLKGKERGWVPVRPIPYHSFWQRCKAAYGVLTGRYDALDWE